MSSTGMPYFLQARIPDTGGPALDVSATRPYLAIVSADSESGRSTRKTGREPVALRHIAAV
jgi:hypothetical protein